MICSTIDLDQFLAYKPKPTPPRITAQHLGDTAAAAIDCCCRFFTTALRPSCCLPWTSSSNLPAKASNESFVKLQILHSAKPGNLESSEDLHARSQATAAS
jgi:hypothetical protein